MLSVHTTCAYFDRSLGLRLSRRELKSMVLEDIYLVPLEDMVPSPCVPFEPRDLACKSRGSLYRKLGTDLVQFQTLQSRET